MIEQQRIDAIRARRRANRISGDIETYADIDTLLTALDEARRENELLARYIVNHRIATQDHACYECSSDSELLVDGFVCGRHVAAGIIAALATKEPT